MFLQSTLCAREPNQSCGAWARWDNRPAPPARAYVKVIHISATSRSPYLSSLPGIMYGPDVFAVFTNKASSAFELEHNLRWFRKATGGVAVAPTINSRETTPAEDSQSDDDDNNVKEEDSAVDRLVVTFDQLLALDNPHNGLQLGTNPLVSHVLLGYRGTKGISGKQVRQFLRYESMLMMPGLC